MPRADSSAGSCVVEQERLLALVDTQRRHIDELRKQLRDTLEVQKQQQLQLIQRSPARKSVRKLLERAAADNTALANRVEELRAQRNALCITKAALTAQVSELIRVAADDRTRDDQHRLLLHQLHQLCRLIQQPHLQQPEQQMAAVVGHIKQLYRERQELSEKLEAATRSSSNNNSSSGTKQHQQTSAAAACCAAPPSSPTGLKLDQRATSRLIWTNSCSDLFAQQQERHRQLAAAAAAAGHSSSSTGSSTVVTDDTQAAQAPQQAPVAAADTSAACTDSFCTAQSHLLDMSYISPLRSTANTSSSSSKLKGPGEAATPCSKPPAETPAGGTASAAAPTEAAAGPAVECGAGPVSTPLSAQSLSAFSSAGGGGGDGGGGGRVTPSPRRRQALQLLSPLRRVGLTTTAFNGPTAGAAAAAAGSHCTSEACGSSNNSSSSSSRGLQCCPDLLTPEGLLLEPLQPGQERPAAADRPTAAAAGAAEARLSAVGTAGRGLSPLDTPDRSCCAFGSGISVASSSKPGSVGLCLQPEFRLAAADSLWPSPAANRANMSLAAAAAAAACSTVSSHMLWLPEGEEEAAECSELECSSNEVDLCPRALTDFDFLTGAAGSSSPQHAPSPAADGGASHCSTCPHGEGVPGGDGGVGGVEKRSHRRGVGSIVLGVGVSVAVAAAGGAAAWRHKQHEVLQLAALLQQGAAGAAVRTQQQLAGVLRRVQNSPPRRRTSTSQPAGTL